MFQELAPFPAYKSSGVEWLGQIPLHWEVAPVKQQFAAQLGKMLQGHPNNKDDIKVPYLKALHVQWFHVQTVDPPTMWANQKEIMQFGIKEGDLLVCEGGEGGRCGIVKTNVEGYIIQNAVHRVRSREKSCIDFLQFVLRTVGAMGWFNALNERATIAHLTSERFGALRIPFPPLPEQRAIAAFLDQETAKIDALVAKNERLNKLLQEKRTALISHTVTKGLDPGLSMKSSGVEWLGQIPLHWEVAPVKQQFAAQLGKMLQGHPNNKDDIKVPYLKALHVQWFHVQTVDPPTMWANQKEIMQFGIKEGDLLVCEGGEGGRCGIVKTNVEGYIIQNAVHRVRSREKSCIDFLQFVLRTVGAMGWFNALNERATIAHLTSERFGALRIPFPPLPEQRAIAAFLDQETAKIDALVAKNERLNKLLQEKRTALISTAVAGRINVQHKAG